MRRGRLAATVVVAVLAAHAFAPPASAQEGDRTASAQVLFDDAMTLMDAGRFAEACPKLERSQQLDPGMGTEFRLAECFEKLGRIGSAWTRYANVAEAAAKAGNAEREQVARRRAEALRPRLPRVIIKLSPEAAATPGLAVQRDGAPVDRELLDQPIVVDPGQHQVVATAPGKRQVSRPVAVKEGETAELVVPALEAETTSGPAPPPGGDGTTPPPDRKPGSMQRAVAVGVGVLGLGGLTVGSIFGLRAMSTWNDALDGCLAEQRNACSPDAQEKGDDASTSATISTIAFGVGAAGLAAAAVLWFTAPSGRTEAFIAPRIGAGSAGVTVGGTY